jgi:hypothetical protein
VPPPYTAAQIVALLDSDPVAGILDAADLRERRCDAVTRGEWFAESQNVRVRILGMDETPTVAMPPGRTPMSFKDTWANAEHIAAEANPAHALAAVRRWRGVAERWQRQQRQYLEGEAAVVLLLDRDLTETADEVRAYLGGTP